MSETLPEVLSICEREYQAMMSSEEVSEKIEAQQYESVEEYLEAFETACGNAESNGMKVIKGNESLLLLDLDTEEDVNFFEQMLPYLKDELRVAIVQKWKSKSGVGTHVAISLTDAKLTVLERLVIQACLGSDRKHELLSLFKGVMCGNPTPSVLFQPKDAKVEMVEVAKKKKHLLEATYEVELEPLELTNPCGEVLVPTADLWGEICTDNQTPTTS